MGKSPMKKREWQKNNAVALSFDVNQRNRSGFRGVQVPMPNPVKDFMGTQEDPDCAESKKRSRRHIEFVFPKQNGNAKLYVFSNKQQSLSSMDGAHERLSHSSPKDNLDKVADSDKTEATKESMDEILSSSKRKKHHNSGDNEATSKLRNGKRAATTITLSVPDNVMEGRLSGMSVEEAVRDKSGCRPRANSTDGELNLPRRGLCDEHMVLQSHKWNRDSPNLPPKGFVNLGNTCFLNSTLQCLVYLPPFCQSLLAMSNGMPLENGKKASEGKRITMMLRALFQKVHASDGQHQGAIAPRSLVAALPTLGTCGSRGGGYKFRQGRQEDAHEFLIHLLDAMHDGELREAGINQRMSGWRDRLPVPRLDETTFVHRIFGGYLRSQLRCTKCKYCSNTYDPFLDLALEVSKDSINNVGTAFMEFTRKETLDSDNRWKCGGCGQYVRAIKALTVFRPPLSLCVQMKRFAFGGSSFGLHLKFGGRQGNKITKPIAFPADMNLPLSDGRSCPYALTGVVIHVGGSSNSGHYTAYVRKPTGVGSHQWYHMDDSFVQAVSQKTVLQQKDAYLLFYCRKEVKLEFPPPPTRRSFMSTEEAQELGRARARARADNLPQTGKQKDAGSPVEKKMQRESLSATSEAVPGDADSTYTMRAHDTQITPVVPGVTEISRSHYSETNQRLSEDPGDSSSSSESSEDSSSDNTKKRAAASTEAQASKSNAPISEQRQKAAHKESLNSSSSSSPPRDLNPEGGQARRPTDPLTSSSDSESSEKGSADDSSVDSNEREHGTFVGGKGDGDRSSITKAQHTKKIPSRPSGGTGKNLLLVAIDKDPRRVLSDVKRPFSMKKNSSDDSTPANRALSSRHVLGDPQVNRAAPAEVPANKLELTPKNTGMDEKKIGSNSGKVVTKIVLDRGKGREKVSVVVGRSAKKRWVPQTSGRAQSGEAFDLLGNRTVGKWNDENTFDEATEVSGVVKARTQIVADMGKTERERKRKAHLDRWDQSLDRGRSKKVKAKKESVGGGAVTTNPFQRVLSGLQLMKRFRPKGHLGEKTNSSKKRKRS